MTIRPPFHTSRRTPGKNAQFSTMIAPPLLVTRGLGEPRQAMMMPRRVNFLPRNQPSMYADSGANCRRQYTLSQSVATFIEASLAPNICLHPRHANTLPSEKGADTVDGHESEKEYAAFGEVVNCRSELPLAIAGSLRYNGRDKDEQWGCWFSFAERDRSLMIPLYDRAGKKRRWPIITWLLVLINILVFLYEV